MAPGAKSLPQACHDVGEVLDGPLPGEQVVSVVRPRNAAALAGAEREAIASVVAILLGAVCALPVTQLILWWILQLDPLGIGPTLPDSLEWVVSPQFRNEPPLPE